jgi:DinB family protein
MPETAQQYTQRLLSNTAGKDPLRLQQAAPAKLAALIRGKDRRRLARRPAPGKWSVAEIIAHLADAEVAIAWRLRQVLSTSGVALQAYDQDSWAAAFGYGRRDPKLSLATYTALRAANLALLKSVPRSAFENYGVHSERGKETAAHIVRMVAGHDLNHLAQIERILKPKRR